MRRRRRLEKKENARQRLVAPLSRTRTQEAIHTKLFLCPSTVKKYFADWLRRNEERARRSEVEIEDRRRVAGARFAYD